MAKDVVSWGAGGSESRAEAWKPPLRHVSFILRTEGGIEANYKG